MFLSAMKRRVKAAEQLAIHAPKDLARGFASARLGIIKMARW